MPAGLYPTTLCSTHIFGADGRTLPLKTKIGALGNALTQKMPPQHEPEELAGSLEDCSPEDAEENSVSAPAPSWSWAVTP